MRRKNNIPADVGHFLSAEIDSTDFEKEHSTAKTTYKNHIFFKKNIPKGLEADKTIEQNKK